MPGVFDAARLVELLGGDRRRSRSICRAGLFDGAFTEAQRQRGGGEGDLLARFQWQRLHRLCVLLHRLELVEHAERAFDHLALDVALVRDADVLHHVADHEAIAADEPEHAGEHLVAARTIVAVDEDDLVRLGLGLRTDSLMLAGGRWTAHDLRRTAATLMARLGVSSDVIDECLNHVIESRVRRTYIRDRRPVEQARAFDTLGLRLAALVAPNVVMLDTARVA